MKSKALVEELAGLHQTAIPLWKQSEHLLATTPILTLIEKNHLFNFKLWGEEDIARRDDKGFEFVYQAKRNIDKYNQQRNNYIESIDQAFYEALKPLPHSQCPVHSETPGMMIDRLSILALKTYHMQLQTTREDVDKAHVSTCMQKYETLLEQLSQLKRCLIELLDDIQNGRKTYRLYHQFKMYNDPSLNPELYLKTSEH